MSLRVNSRVTGSFNRYLLRKSVVYLRTLKTETFRSSMSSNDGTTPPVLFVVGTVGLEEFVGNVFSEMGRFLDIDVLAINLDPGAERVHCDPEFDVRDLISLSEVMDEYDLGPNGAQILAADLVASQAVEVFEEIEGLAGIL